MHVPQRVRRTALTVSAALILCTGLSTSARAATGELFYRSTDGEEFTITDPDNGECFLLVGGADRVSNMTDTRATLYTDHGCEENPTSLASHASRDFFPPLVPHSIRFG